MYIIIKKATVIVMNASQILISGGLFYPMAYFL